MKVGKLEKVVFFRKQGCIPHILKQMNQTIFLKLKLEIQDVLKFDSSESCKGKKERQAWQDSAALKITKIQNFKFRKLIWFISIFEDMKNASLLSEEKLPLV